MPVKVGWLVENRISYFKYTGDVTIEEVTEAAAIGLEFLYQSDAPLIHSIQDNSEQTSFPKEVGQLMKSVRTALSDPKMGWMMTVGLEGDVIRFVVTLVGRIARTRHRMFDTLEETVEFLQHVDTSLPDLSNIQQPEESAYLYHLGFPEKNTETTGEAS